MRHSNINQSKYLLYLSLLGLSTTDLIVSQASIWCGSINWELWSYWRSVFQKACKPYAHCHTRTWNIQWFDNRGKTRIPKFRTCELQIKWPKARVYLEFSVLRVRKSEQWSQMAERAGFEPAWDIIPSRFRVGAIWPLWHLSSLSIKPISNRQYNPFFLNHFWVVSQYRTSSKVCRLK